MTRCRTEVDADGALMFTEKRTGKHTHSVIIDGERGRGGEGQKAHIYRKTETHTLTYNNHMGQENLG